MSFMKLNLCVVFYQASMFGYSTMSALIMNLGIVGNYLIIWSEIMSRLQLVDALVSLILLLLVI